MTYWIEKDNKYISICKQGNNTKEFIAYQEIAYAEFYEAEFEVMVAALNSSVAPKIVTIAETAEYKGNGAGESRSFTKQMKKAVKF